MKLFEKPEMEVVMFTVEDIVTTSEGDNSEGDNFFDVPCIS